MNFLKESKTNWKYILIVVILAVVVGGGALWFSVKKELPYQPPEIKKVDQTADWKTYRNEEYGFEIKYPQDFDAQGNGSIVSFCGGEHGYCGIGGASYHSETYLYKFKKSGPEEDLYNFAFGSGKSLENDYWPFGKDPNTIDCQVIPITINEASGKVWDCKYGTGYGELEAFWEKQKDDSFYLMSISLSDEFPDLRNTFNQMLSTFRFLE